VRGWFARPLDRAGSGRTATRTATAPGAWHWRRRAWQPSGLGPGSCCA